MSPLVGYHVTRPACRESIKQDGLIPAQPVKGRPFGVYVCRWDGEFDHPTWESHAYWCHNRNSDVWEAAYIGPLTFDQYVLNGFIFLERVTVVTLVTGNIG